jgi:opacity protein-like surface antigen
VKTQNTGRQKLIYGIGLSISLFALTTQAAIRPVVTLGLGGDSTDLNINQNITVFAPFQNTYVGHHNDTESVGSLFIGAEIPFLNNFAWQLGAAYYQTINPFQPTGVVEQFGDPLFANLNYYFNITSRRYLFQTKLLYTLREYFHPYITGAVGEAVNHSYDYTETGVTSFDVGMGSPFANKTVRSFTYAGGLGIDIDVNAHMRFGVGYEFTNLGHAGLGTSPIQDGNERLKINNLNTNEFMMQLSYIG